MREMGSICWNPECGALHDLEFDHPFGRDWKPREKSSQHRMNIYRREWEAGKLQILCSDCNEALKRKFPHAFPRPAVLEAEQPF